MVGPRTSGKTVVLTNLVTNLLWHYTDKGEKVAYWDFIMLCSPTAADDESAAPMMEVIKMYGEHVKEFSGDVIKKCVKIYEDFSGKIPYNQWGRNEPNILLILDDCMDQIPTNGAVRHPFRDLSIKNRHKNISIIYNCQQYKGASTWQRGQTSTFLFFWLPSKKERHNIEDEIADFEFYYHKAVMSRDDRENRNFLTMHVRECALHFYRKFEEYLGHC